MYLHHSDLVFRDDLLVTYTIETTFPLHYLVNDLYMHNYEYCNTYH